MCSSQVLRAGMDGTVVGLDLKAVIEILRLYGEDNRRMFEEIVYLWFSTQKYRKDK